MNIKVQHNLQQWLFLSRKKTLTVTDGAVDGWEMEVWTEKNKLAPSQHSITCIFDKHTGIDKFWSEFIFLASEMPSENRIYTKKKKKNPNEFMMKQSGAYYYLDITNPEDTSVKYTSDKFYRKDAKNKYNSDPTFKQWFDYAVQISVHYRIKHGIFKQSERAEGGDVCIDSVDPQQTPEVMNIMDQLDAVVQPVVEPQPEQTIVDDPATYRDQVAVTPAVEQSPIASAMNTTITNQPAVAVEQTVAIQPEDPSYESVF